MIVTSFTNLTNFGKISRKLAIDKDISLGQMALAVGCTKQYFSQIQHGKVPLTLSIFKDFVSAYGKMLSKEDKELCKDDVVLRNSKYAQIKVNENCPDKLAELLNFIKDNLTNITEEKAEYLRIYLTISGGEEE